MSLRARLPPGRAALALALSLVASLAAPDARAEKAETFTIDYPPLGFRMAIAVPQGGSLCIIIPESAQDPTACLGLDPSAMVEALPQGPDRPFGVAYARAGEWSYVVMLSPMNAGVEAREDIEEIVGGAEKAVKEATSLVPKVIADTPDQRFDILRVKDVPVVKFRIDAPHPPDSPQYELGTTLYYAAYGGKAAMVTFITSPRDIDKVMPYAEASVQTLVLPPREAPERFGKPRAELNQRGTRMALTIFGPLVAFGVLLFWWLGRSRKTEPEPAPAAKKRKAVIKDEDAPASDRRDEDEDAPASDRRDEDEAEDEEEGGASSEQDAPSSDRDGTKQDGASSGEDAPPSGDGAKK